MKKLFSFLLAAVLLVTMCAGCGEGQTDGADSQEAEAPSGIFYDITGIAPGETLMTVEGRDIPADVYFYWVSYLCSSLEYQVGMYYTYYGMYSDYINPDDGAIHWDVEFLDGQTLGQYARSEAERTILFYTAIEMLAEENGVTLTDEDKAAMEENVASAVADLGSEEEFEQYLAKLGIDRDTFDQLSSSGYLFDGLTKLVLQEGSPLYLAPEDYDQYATYADHILLATKDLTTGESLSEEEIAAKRQTAEDLLAQLQASDDVGTLFAQLADEYSEDTGRTSNPNGYIYTPGTMVTAFEDAAAALKPGEISGIVESDYGYHIILRKDLTEALAEDEAQRTALAETHLSDLLSLMSQDFTVEYSEKLDGFDAGAFYTSYLSRLEELFPEEDASAGDGGADTGSGDTSSAS